MKTKGVFFSDGQVLDAAWLSVRVAVCAATVATVLGTLAGTALARFGAFRGRSLLIGMTTAPIVMPEVISGLSLLLLFVALQQVIGWPRGMGALTITLAHISFCMAYVTVVIQSRITLPLILPAVLAGWLLAFTLSWDDLVISQFVAGPGSSTLPMVIFSKVRLGVSPDVNALATLMVSVVASGVVVTTLWMRHRQRRRERDAQLAAAANL